jgi:hypothetical protein
MPEDKYARVRVDSTTFVGHTIKLVEQLTSKVRLLRPQKQEEPKRLENNELSGSSVFYD